MKRYGQVIRIKPEQLPRYKELHANTWPQVLQTIRECNIRNYTIFHKDDLLFAYFEYVGEDYQADMRKMAADPVTQQWWDVTKPCHIPLESRQPGEWWADMEPVFHTD